MTTDDIMALANKYAASNGKALLEKLYGTTRSYTEQCTAEAFQDRQALRAAIEKAAAELRRLYFENEKLRSAPQPAKPAEQDSPWCMKMNDCKTKCEDCPDEVPQPAEQEPAAASVPDAMRVVLGAMRADPEYAWGWHCNVAMAFVDEGGDHATANHAAARFMRLLAGVDPAHELPAKQAPPAKQPLTIEEIYECERIAAIRHHRHKNSIRGQQLTPADDPQWHFANAIIAAYERKNGIGEQP